MYGSNVFGVMSLFLFIGLGFGSLGPRLPVLLLLLLLFLLFLRGREVGRFILTGFGRIRKAREHLGEMILLLVPVTFMKLVC
jgi:hypothetical protein